MEKLCIDVRGFSEEKKKRVQDAFFALGYKWSSPHAYQHLGADWYGNVCRNGAAIGELIGYGDMSEQQRKHAITYTDLMRKAGMDESDPDAWPTEKQAEKVAPKQVGELSVGLNLEVETDLQSVISDYLFLLDSIKDPYARGVIKSQITDLTDLQYKQLTGEN